MAEEGIHVFISWVEDKLRLQQAWEIKVFVRWLLSWMFVLATLATFLIVGERWLHGRLILAFIWWSSPGQWERHGGRSTGSWSDCMSSREAARDGCCCAVCFLFIKSETLAHSPHSTSVFIPQLIWSGDSLKACFHGNLNGIKLAVEIKWRLSSALTLFTYYW